MNNFREFALYNANVSVFISLWGNGKAHLTIRNNNYSDFGTSRGTFFSGEDWGYRYETYNLHTNTEKEAKRLYRKFYKMFKEETTYEELFEVARKDKADFYYDYENMGPCACLSSAPDGTWFGKEKLC